MDGRISMKLSENDARYRMDLIVEQLKSTRVPADAPRTRGIVICGGGLRYFTCAWVCINMLRYHGCTLPIELWHLGPREMNDGMCKVLRAVDVTTVDAEQVRETHPVRVLHGWELKPYAIIHSKFDEVLLLDADNIPVINPTFLFESQEYKEFGAIFWPDFNRLQPDRAIWRLAGVSYRDEPEFETGQIVIDKGRCENALALTMWMNEYSDFWYRYIHGDKETFHIAWRKLGQRYAMTSHGIHRLNGTMCQHDFNGRRVFQHRNLKKWTIGKNARVPGFHFEKECIDFLDQLRPHMRELYGFAPFDQELSRELVGSNVRYHRVGYDQRPMTLLDNGTIGRGEARLERFWGIRQSGNSTVLEIYGEDGVTARLQKDRVNPSIWRGFWLIHERMPLEIIKD